MGIVMAANLVHLLVVDMDTVKEGAARRSRRVITVNRSLVVMGMVIAMVI
jgi:hypothetical protein